MDPGALALVSGWGRGGGVGVGVGAWRVNRRLWNWAVKWRGRPVIAAMAKMSAGRIRMITAMARMVLVSVMTSVRRGWWGVPVTRDGVGMGIRRSPAKK